MTTRARWLSAAWVASAVLALTALAEPVAALGPAVPRPAPPTITVPIQVSAGSPITVAVTATPIGSRRTATLATSLDGSTFTPFSSWTVTGRGRRVVIVPTGPIPGRLYLTVTVRGGGVPVQTKAASVRVFNPYRPSAPDNISVPEAGVPVTAALFGNHPINGIPEAAGTLRLWDTATAWNQIEPARGQFRWDALDRAVASAQAHGQEVLLVLGGTPAWAAVGPAPGSEFAGTGSSMPMTDPVLFEEYIRAVVTRYGPRIQAYQVWNEANIPSFWRGTPVLMADLTARAYRIIRELQPDATVVAASTGSRWVKGFTDFYPAYLDALKVFNWPIDVFSVHLYPLATGTPRDRSYLLGLMRTALRIAGAPDRPLWETEVNYGVTNPGLGDAARAIPEGEIPGYVSRTYLDSLRYGIARTYWYAWTPDYRLLGIQMWNGYPATGAMRATYDWLVGSTFSGCTTTGVIVVCNFDRGGAAFYVAYTDDGLPSTVATPVGMTTVTALDGATVPVGAQVPIGGTPVRIT